MKGFICAAFLGAFAYGWFSNIIELATSPAFGGMEVARGIGVFVAPIGAVLGFF